MVLFVGRSHTLYPDVLSVTTSKARRKDSPGSPGIAGIEIFGTYDYSIMTVTTGNGPSK